ELDRVRRLRPERFELLRGDGDEAVVAEVVAHREVVAGDLGLRFGSVLGRCALLGSSGRGAVLVRARLDAPSATLDLVSLTRKLDGFARALDDAAMPDPAAGRALHLAEADVVPLRGRIELHGDTDQPEA